MSELCPVCGEKFAFSKESERHRVPDFGLPNFSTVCRWNNRYYVHDRGWEDTFSHEIEP